MGHWKPKTICSHHHDCWKHKAPEIMGLKKMSTISQGHPKGKVRYEDTATFIEPLPGTVFRTRTYHYDLSLWTSSKNILCIHTYATFVYSVYVHIYSSLKYYQRTHSIADAPGNKQVQKQTYITMLRKKGKWGPSPGLFERKDRLFFG